MTSIRSMLSRSMSCVSQNTPESIGVYTVRPSTRTSNLFEYCPLKPRMLMAHLLELIWATSTPGTMRSKSGTLFAPERTMSSLVMTKIAAAVLEIFCSFFETEVTSMFIRSSRFTLVKSCCDDVWPSIASQMKAKRITPRSPFLPDFMNLFEIQTSVFSGEHETNIWLAMGCGNLCEDGGRTVASVASKEKRKLESPHEDDQYTTVTRYQGHQRSTENVNSSSTTHAMTTHAFDGPPIPSGTVCELVANE